MGENRKSQKHGQDCHHRCHTASLVKKRAKLKGRDIPTNSRLLLVVKKKHFSFTQLVGETEMLSVVWSLGENLAATKEERREAMPREPTSHGHIVVLFTNVFSETYGTDKLEVKCWSICQLQEYALAALLQNNHENF